MNRQRQRLKAKGEQVEDLQRRLGESEQQLREKEDQNNNLTSQLRETEQQLREREDQNNHLTSQLRETEQQLREKEDQNNHLTSQLRETEQQLREKEDQNNHLTSQLSETEQQLTNLQGQHREQVTIQQQVNELQETLTVAQYALSEYERQQVPPDWVISRDQIRLTDKLLGEGGWGRVFEGKYCGSFVAVKQMHELILSPHNRSLFEREMNIAARCRHPCLLQFIGATYDEGSPLFVTELMESNLRTLLGQRPLSSTEISIISLDVARALNYLHQKEPSPIIHRDISSANVLLWRQGDQWRGKVSDYGSANFMQRTMTAAPGARIYSAPEVLTTHQTVKVSYDVLKVCHLLKPIA